MQMKQIAIAVFNDPSTQVEQKKAYFYWLNEGHRTGALLQLLPVIFAELRKPIYEGASFDSSPWEAAAELLDSHIELELAKCTGEKNHV
jgi:hypothetical protein